MPVRCLVRFFVASAVFSVFVFAVVFLWGVLSFCLFCDCDCVCLKFLLLVCVAFDCAYACFLRF